MRWDIKGTIICSVHILKLTAQGANIAIIFFFIWKDDRYVIVFENGQPFFMSKNFD